MTDYKDIMNGKREIPISSCPSCIEDQVYGTGGTSAETEIEESASFKVMLDNLDAKAEKYKPKNVKPKQRQETMFDRMSEIRKEHPLAKIYFCSVDTYNYFSLFGSLYHLDDIPQYRPKQTKHGLLYDMDKIICAVDGEHIFLYDQNGHYIKRIKK